MKTKNIIAVLAVAALAVSSFTGCSKVPAGSVGVKVHLLGGEKGVDHEILTPGRYYIGVNEDLFLFPTFQQNYTWTKNPTEGNQNDESISFQSVEGLTINSDIGITYSVDPEKVSLLFQKYRRAEKEITDIFLRNMVRDALNQRASQLKVEDIYGKSKSQLIKDVQADVIGQVKDYGIIIEKIYLIGDFRLPQPIIDSINAKIASTQKAEQRQNEVAQATAEAQKKIEEAKGQKAANELQASSITPELLEYQKILLQQAWVEKWDGKQPNTLFTSGNSNGAAPVIQIPISK